jgi:hypothetical protein
MVLDLALAGKRVGITAVSHKVIRKLLAEVYQASQERKAAVEPYHKVGRGEVEVTRGITPVQTNEKALAAVRGGAVVGGTAWLWSRDDAARALDHLFVDEAGQMALAPTLAASRAAESLVLLGDPQQLEQRHGVGVHGLERIPRRTWR